MSTASVKRSLYSFVLWDRCRWIQHAWRYEVAARGVQAAGGEGERGATATGRWTCVPSPTHQQS